VRTDVSRAEEVEALARRTLDHFGAVHVVFNNAGVAVTGAAWENSLADWEWVLGVNLWGVIHGIRTFVPILLRQGEPGHVVNTASMAGLLSNPGMAVYNVTKFGVVTLSETLQRDLAAQNARVGVSVLCPGFTATRIMDSARNRAGSERKDPPPPEPSELGAAIELALRRGVDAGISPDQVAGWVIDAIRDDRFYVMPPGPEVAEGLRARMDDLLERRNPGALRLLQET
jgi:NAD(P)-dependent dehydrogenase (short-subunit alcohol dehydrogenase family)